MLNFQSKLKENNLKTTPQRVAILNEIKKLGHASVDDIYSGIKKEHPSISLATVYKNITLMHDANILLEVKAPSQKQKYEISMQRHIHLSCERCGKLEDVYIDNFEFLNGYEKRNGYQINNISAVLIGICPECQEAQE